MKSFEKKKNKILKKQRMMTTKLWNKRWKFKKILKKSNKIVIRLTKKLKIWTFLLLFYKRDKGEIFYEKSKKDEGKNKENLHKLLKREKRKKEKKKKDYKNKVW